MRASTAVSPRPWFAFPLRVDEPSTRLVAAGVAGGIVAGLLTGLAWVLPVLALGFVLRIVAGPRYSPLARAAAFASRQLGLAERPIAGAPKQFAAAIGASLLTAASLLAAVGLSAAAWAVAGLVALFAGLEAAFAFCLGCRLHTALFGCDDCLAPEVEP